MGDQAKVQLLMLNLDGRALEWHYFFVQRNGGLQHLTWEQYARALQDRFGSARFLDPMTKLVALK